MTPSRSRRVLHCACVLVIMFFVWMQCTDKSVPSAEIDLQEQVEDILASQIEQDDPRLLRIIRQRYLLSPPSEGTAYALKNPSVVETSMGQEQKIKEIFNNKRGGFFVECGALDGETRSNTLQLERQLGWQGLLVEADPLNFRELLARRRHAHLAPVCLSLVPRATRVTFMQWQSRGRILAPDDASSSRRDVVEVQCLPVTSLVLALNRTTVDYFSLDVEGDELAILKTIPFDRVDIKTLSVEFIHGREGKEVLRQFMEARGYRVHSEVTAANNLANDFIFVKDGITVF